MRLLISCILVTPIIACGPSTDGDDGGEYVELDEAYGLTKADLDLDLGERQVGTGEPLVPAAGSLVLRDDQTGSLWNLRGEAFSGPMADDDVRLRVVPAFTAFWFAWSAFNADSDVWTSTGIVAHENDEPIDTDAGCDVPCDEILNGGPPKDGIPSVDFDQAVGRLSLVPGSSTEADYLGSDDLILGVAFYRDGQIDARAYSHNVMWWHEIANDEIAGERFTISYCPLTGSGMHTPGGENDFSFGTSGRLFNSNLIKYDRVTDTNWSQMMRTAITGNLRGEWFPIHAIYETTWAKWRGLFPDTLVTSTDTDHDRDYSRYPYVSQGVDYRTDDTNTFLPTNPDYDRRYGAKEMVLGVRAGLDARAYPLVELAADGERRIVNDTLGALDLAVVWDADGRLAIAFDRHSGPDLFTFTVESAP